MSTSVETAAALDVRGIGKNFGGVVALQEVDLQVRDGEIVAIVGDNGAGKSTLMKIIAGAQLPSRGQLLVDGTPVHFDRPSDSRAHGIEVVYQDLALAESQEVFMNMFLGRELVRTPFALLQKRRMRRETTAILDELDVHVPSSRSIVRNLSGGQRQGVAIGRAVHWARRLVLMDEPTAALGVQETAKVEQTITRLRQRGLAVLLVSHNLDQVFRLSDRIYVLRRGQMAGHLMTKECRPDDVVAMITGSR
jgi:ABC-type sugar transport system ATPase subunit